MPSGPIIAVGRTLAAVAGFIWGVSRGLRPPYAAEEDAVEESIKTSALNRIGEDDAGGKEDYVTRRELAEALDRSEKRLDAGVAEQFRTQALAIGSLQAMINDTDTLLERVLERLEASANATAESNNSARRQGDAAGREEEPLLTGLRRD